MMVWRDHRRRSFFLQLYVNARHMLTSRSSPSRHFAAEPLGLKVSLVTGDVTSPSWVALTSRSLRIRGSSQGKDSTPLVLFFSDQSPDDRQTQRFSMTVFTPTRGCRLEFCRRAPVRSKARALDLPGSRRDRGRCSIGSPTTGTSSRPATRAGRFKNRA
jgi:hypothetical protein